ncbi:MAG TPA: hypothetical protein VHC22_23460 [Pirellulales bacterium]|nr:hypothetical protein [Pirellulales bacterium]
MFTDRRLFLKKITRASSGVVVGGTLLSARFLQQAHARYALKGELLGKSLPLLNDKEAEELAHLPQKAQDDIRQYFHGVCLNVHGFTERVCSNGFAEKLKSCASDEQKHALLNVAFSQKVATGIEVLNRVDVIAGEIGAELDRNWSKLCGQLNDSWKLTLKSAMPSDQRLDLVAVTQDTILQSLGDARSRAYPLGQRPALSETISEIGKAAILLLPVAAGEPQVAFPWFLIRALVSAWSYVLGRLAHPAADYQLAITEHLAALGNRVAAECEQEVRRRIADLHTYQQQAIDVAATKKVNQIIGALI